MNKYQEFINKNVDTRDILEQLAEEASELAQASLKAIRANGLSNNPTPLLKMSALSNLIEEKDDVDLLFKIYMKIDVDETQYPKLKRWAERIGYTENGKE